MEKMVNVKEKKEEYKNNLNYTYCDNICDYSDGYICDVITEIADNNVDIYYYDLFEWAKNNFDAINEANDELGTPNDIIKQIQQGQYLQIERELYDNFDDMIKLYIYDFIYNVLNIEEITEEQAEKIDDSNFDNNDKLDDVNDFINDLFEEVATDE